MRYVLFSGYIGKAHSCSRKCPERKLRRKMNIRAHIDIGHGHHSFVISSRIRVCIRYEHDYNTEGVEGVHCALMLSLSWPPSACLCVSACVCVCVRASADPLAGHLLHLLSVAGYLHRLYLISPNVCHKWGTE